MTLRDRIYLTWNYGKAQFLLGGGTPPASADVNGDNQVNIADVTALIDRLLGS